LGCREDLLPLLVGRDPWQLCEPRNKPSIPLTAKPFAGGVPAAANWIAHSLPAFDEVVIKQANRDQTLLERGVG
jgi:hypothetical protein